MCRCDEFDVKLVAVPASNVCACVEFHAVYLYIHFTWCPLVCLPKPIHTHMHAISDVYMCMATPKIHIQVHRYDFNFNSHRAICKRCMNSHAVVRYLSTIYSGASLFLSPMSTVVVDSHAPTRKLQHSLSYCAHHFCSCCCCCFSSPKLFKNKWDTNLMIKANIIAGTLVCYL